MPECRAKACMDAQDRRSHRRRQGLYRSGSRSRPPMDPYSESANLVRLRAIFQLLQTLGTLEVHVQPSWKPDQRLLLPLHLGYREAQPRGPARTGAGEPAQTDRELQLRASPPTPACANGSWARCASSKPSRKTCAPRRPHIYVPVTSLPPASTPCSCGRRGAARREPQAARSGRRHLQESGQSSATWRCQTARAKIESLKGAINDMKMNQASWPRSTKWPRA